MVRIPLFCTLSFFLVQAGCLLAQDIGSRLPAWQEGYLDIHHINTGTGECAFILLPDGTSMLVDAGVHARELTNKVATPKPSDGSTPGVWIARYISRLLGQTHKDTIDYVVITHFDTDHIGGILPGMKQSRGGNYTLTGISEVLEHLPAVKIMDRGWPGYDWPAPPSREHVVNYVKFVKWQVANNKVRAERFIPGRNDQIVMRHDPGRFPAFEIRNIVANGVAWTGTGTEVQNHFPPVETLSETLPSENASSLAFKLSYGKFDYFTGGDLTGVIRPGRPAWQDIETPVAKVTGQVDVQVLNHHGYIDAQNGFWLSTLKPRVFVLQSWDSHHPSKSTLERMLSKEFYPGDRDIFATNIIAETRAMVGDDIERLKSQQGHIVVRVSPGGNEYRVYILDDSDESALVKSIHGPYESQ